MNGSDIPNSRKWTAIITVNSVLPMKCRFSHTKTYLFQLKLEHLTICE